MNRIGAFVLTAIAAVFLVACGSPTGRAPANSANTTSANPASKAPTADELLALENQADEADYKGDVKFFEGLVSDKFVRLWPDGSRMDKAAALKIIAGLKCDVKDGWKLDEPHLSKVDADTYLLIFKGTFDGTCTVDGKTSKMPSPVRGATVWVRSGDKWQAAFHGENLIVDPTAPPTAKAGAGKEPLKVDNKAGENSNTAASAESTGDATTDALVKAELALWNAWKARDSQKIGELMAKDVAFVDIFGNVVSTKADTLKFFADQDCDIEEVGISDGVSTSLSPAVAILTFKGTAKGTCSGQKLDKPIYGTSVYVKDGDAWRWAFTLNSPG